MQRPAFDPSKMAAKRDAGSLFAGTTPGESAGRRSDAPGPDAPASGGERPLTVSQLCAMIDATLRAGLVGKLRVVGEVSGLSDRTHWYFSLKDADAVVSCVMFASAARAVRFRPENGHEVVATGRVEFFGKQGRTQLYVERLEPVGAGALDLEFRRLCDELRAMGWFEAARKRPLPAFPRRIAVITSRTSAAWQDVLNTVQRRCPAVGLALCDVRVQGDAAVPEIVRALRWISARHADLGVDAILLTRGGGSREDLWTFNDRAIAEAVVQSRVPVVAAIGHESDTSIAELVADERCATPTQAAMRLTPDARALAEHLDALAARARAIVVRHLREQSRRVGAAADSAALSSPERLVAPRQRAVDELSRRLAAGARAECRRLQLALERVSAQLESHRPAAVYARRAGAVERVAAALQAALRSRLGRADPGLLARRLAHAAGARDSVLTAQLDSLDRALDLVGPASVLRRGYSMTLGPGGDAVRSVSDVRPGTHIRTVVADGSFAAVVGDGGPGAAALPPDALRDAARRAQQRAARRRLNRGDTPTDQLDLFRPPPA